MKVQYREETANHSDPESCVIHREVYGEALAGETGRPAIEPQNRLLKEGYTHVVDADLKSYFDTIPKGPMLARVAERISDGKVLGLIQRYLEQEILEGLKRWTPTAGTPQGAVLSPLLANLYLHPLDRHITGQGWKMVRYADDFVILCRDKEEAEQALQAVRYGTGPRPTG